MYEEQESRPSGPPGEPSRRDGRGDDDARPLDASTERARRLLDTDAPAARTLAGRVIAIARGLRDEHALARNLCTAGSAAIVLREYTTAEADLSEALRLAERLRDDALRVDVLRGLLKCAFFSQDHHAALGHGIAALHAAHRCDDEGRTALVHNELGLIYGSAHDFEGALEHLLAGLALMRKQQTDNLATVLNNIGNVYLELGDHAQALEFFRSGREAFQAHGQPRGAAIAAGNIGRALMGLGEAAAARAEFEASLREFEANEDHAYLAPALARLASAHEALGDEHGARRCFGRSLDALEGASRPEFGDEALLAAGRFHLARGEADRAIELLAHSLALLRQAPAARRLHDLHQALAAAYEQQHEPAAALRHFKEFHRLSTEAADTAVTIRIRGLMLQFDLERARQDQEIYRLRNVELAQANDELRRLHDELEARNQELQQISVEDALTGVHNRRYLDAQLDHEVARSVRRNRPLALAICDLDSFKEINDELSHAIGDDVLRAIGELLRATIRHDDIVARYGGEEFVVLMPETDRAGAEVLAERLRANVERFDWSRLHPALKVTLSIGIATLRPGLDPEGLLARADAMLYDAKRSGRNRVCA